MKPKIICLTPVKNESWILDIFLKSTSLWADYIIIADQMSTDGSREIALQYPKVKLIDNTSPVFNEPERQKLLIDEARKIEGQKLLVALDADELLTPDFINSMSWKKITNSEPGTVFNLQWANIYSNFKGYWCPCYFPCIFMDNGYEHNQFNKIHTTRIPVPPGTSNINIDDIMVIHLQYVNWKRMQSKHRWYQCYERITYPEKMPVDIFRLYHHMYEIEPDTLMKVPGNWMQLYKENGVDISKIIDNEIFWWDEKVLDYFDKYGTFYFRKINIWDINWKKTAQKLNRQGYRNYRDPRSVLDRLILYFLFVTQKHKNKYLIRKITNQIRKRY